MQKKYMRAAVICCAVVFACLLSQPAFAVSPDELRAQVEAAGKTAASGSVLIWVLCALAFLKVSQKIDSMLSSLGLNVGHTGGSILAETMIAMRAVTGVRNIGGNQSVTGNHTSNTQNNHMGGGGKFPSGGLVGAVSRTIQNSAVRSTVQSAGTPGRSPGGIGGALYSASVQNGGSFANNVIGTIATGSLQSTGSLTGERASEALNSYMGYAALPEGNGTPPPTFDNVEIGGGRITGTETSAEHPNGIEFGMYNADQYASPEGTYSTVFSADGAAWYKQYARPTVERTPYYAPDGSVEFHSSIVQRMPRAPQRKERL